MKDPDRFGSHLSVSPWLAEQLLDVDHTDMPLELPPFVKQEKRAVFGAGVLILFALLVVLLSGCGAGFAQRINRASMAVATSGQKEDAKQAQTYHVYDYGNGYIQVTPQ